MRILRTNVSSSSSSSSSWSVLLLFWTMDSFWGGLSSSSSWKNNGFVTASPILPSTLPLLSQYMEEGYDDENDNHNKLFQQPVPSPLPSLLVPSSFYPPQSSQRRRVQGRVGVRPQASSSFQVEQHSDAPLMSTVTSSSSSSSCSSSLADCRLQNYSSDTIADTISDDHAEGKEECEYYDDEYECDDEYYDDNNQYHAHDDDDECYDDNCTSEYGYHVEERTTPKQDASIPTTFALTRMKNDSHWKLILTTKVMNMEDKNDGMQYKYYCCDEESVSQYFQEILTRITTGEGQVNPWFCTGGYVTSDHQCIGRVITVASSAVSTTIYFVDV